ncbi:unnamed protein product [Ostreobium quekettii]|uniref:C3H1-type domain-containing protein n=1 Tax=Ostreobium quekettii TaxID=121088 RepID=A0A8S1J680_9CHLO|nr:unnamed protein product [Ostreobium quekettii]|eukprot:evm.model.scf_3727.1 EVM.evm.TU.scf_3727.1   scf_3727:1048-4521(+)
MQQAMTKAAKDREAAAGLDVLYASDEFRMYCFKVLPCSKHYSHDWTVCPFAHPGEKARRRDPRVFRYAGVECPHVKEGLKCPRGDLCPFAHNIFECWLHPTRYRTQLCNEPASCRRKVCFFAHALEELREPSNPLESIPKEAGAKAARLSLDSSASTTMAGMGASRNTRRSMEIPMSPQPPAEHVQVSVPLAGVPQLPHNVPAALSSLSQATGSNMSMNDVAGLLQQLTVSMGSQQLPQNDRIVQLLIMLLGEIAHANGGQPVDRHSMDSIASGTHRPAFPRVSIDNHGLPMSAGMNLGFASNGTVQLPGDAGHAMASQEMIPEHEPLKAPLGRVSVDTMMNPYGPGMHTRGPSIDALGAVAVSEAISMGLSGVRRVSVDSALLTGYRPVHGARAAPGMKYGMFDASTMTPSMSYNGNMVDAEVLRSSSDSSQSDETQMERPSADGPLPDAFILHS